MKTLYNAGAKHFLSLAIVLLAVPLSVCIIKCTPPYEPTTTTITDECALEGENYSSVYPEYPEHCCEGLTDWESGFDTRVSIGDACYATGLVAGVPIGTCINCGNGICEDIENVCNCEEDCAGGLSSDYDTVDAFCASAIWKDTLSSLCVEWLKVGDYPICYLCE